MPGTITINVSAEANLPPDIIGNKFIIIDYGNDYSFDKNDFTTGTTPPYHDPEGDNMESIKILTLPSIGSLELSSVPVSVNDIISESNITNLDYISDTGTTVSYIDNFTYTASDVGSSTFSSEIGTVYITVNAYINQPPTIGDLTKNLDYGESWIITLAELTTGTTPAYSDPEGDAAEFVKLVVLPTSGTLKLDGITCVLNQIISVDDINNNLLTYEPNLAETSGDTDSFEFKIADEGSGEYSS